MIPKEILKKVHRIEIKTRTIVNSTLGGEYKSAFKGKGMEFSEVRPYVPGDDIRSIDWNVTARSGEPYIKKHIEERELTVMLLVDASASGNFGSLEKFKAETAVELCAVLSFSAIKNNDRVGLIIFTSEVEKFIPPKKGKNHVLRVIRELLYFKPSASGTDIGAAVRFLNQILSRRAVLFCVSDFRDNDFMIPLRVVSRRHDVIAVTLSDPREYEIPNVGLVELCDPETRETLFVDSASPGFQRHYKERIQKRVAQLRDYFRQNKIDEIAVSTSTDYVEALVQFFHRREKMMK